MKKLLALTVFCSCTHLHAQVRTTVEVECFSLIELASLLNEYNEAPLSAGSILRGDEKGAVEHTMILFVNPKTKTWTLAEKTTKGLYCVLTAGSNFDFIRKEQPI